MNIDPEGLHTFSPSPDQSRELTCFFCTVYAEERGGTKECQWAVASTIINRLADQRNRGRSTTICDIVKTPGAYAGYEGGQNPNYQQCEACKIPPHAKPDFDRMMRNFGDPFPINPDARFYAANRSAISVRYYESRTKPKKKGDRYFVRIPYPPCPTNNFYNETR
jgi:hypothetical protein